MPDLTYRRMKYRLYPTKDQVATMERWLVEACSLYNAALQERREAWNHSKKMTSFYSQCAQLKDIRAHGDIAIEDYTVAREALRRADSAYARFFARVKKGGGKAGFPRYKPTHQYQSFGYDDYSNGCRLLDDRCLRLHGIGIVRIKLHRPINGDIKQITIKNDFGKWYATFIVKMQVEPLAPSTEVVGFDLGISRYVTFSDGTSVENPRWWKSSKAKLRRATRRITRTQQGSKGRRDAVQAFRRNNIHVKNQRADFQHKLSHDIVAQYGLIAAENLNILKMTKNMLGQEVRDAGWGLFLGKLAYKAESAGRQLVLVNPDGTTQNCSCCGEKVEKQLRDRWHDCPYCGLSLNRDHNAAINILGAGLALVAPTLADTPCVATEVERQATRPLSASLSVPCA